MHATMWRAVCRAAAPVPNESYCFKKSLMPRSLTMRAQPERQPSRASTLSLGGVGCPSPPPDTKLTLKPAINSSGAAVLSATGRKGGAPKAVNQDSFLAEAVLAAPGNAVATVIGVFDGHGKDGHHASSFVKSAVFSALHLCFQQAVQTLLPSPAASADCTDVSNLGAASALASEQPPPGAFPLAKCELSPEQVSAALEGSFEAAADGLRAGHEARQLDAAHSGSTACVCVVTGNSVVAAWAGDSRAVLGRAEGGSYSATQLTRDHKPNNLSEMARIMAAGGMVARALDRQGRPSGPFRVMHRPVPGTQAAPGLAVARAFGDLQLASAGIIPTPELAVFQRSSSGSSSAAPCPQELLVVGSDGLWDVVSNEEAVAVAAGAGCPEAGAEALMAEAKARWVAARGGLVRDDITVAVAYL